jgi:flavin-dependent thymidylate synthase
MQIEFLDVTTPSDVAVSAARTCYFPNGLVKPEKSSEWARKKPLLASIFKAGHHTTLQHTHITMMITGMSRHLIWRLLHSHSYYNSEQISQRYAKMKIENFFYPPKADKATWETFYAQSFEDYEEIIKLLDSDINAALPKFKKGQEAKVAQEMARYLLPVGMSAYLYHTVNIVTLLRYIAVAPYMPEAREEAMEFARLIEEQLLTIDDALKPLIDHAKESTSKFPEFDIDALKDRIHADDNVKVYDVTGDADFEDNSNYADVLRSSQMMFDSGILGGFSTYIEMSFSADAQNQRHRRSPGVRPAIEANFSERYYTPPIIANNPEAKAVYDQSHQRMYAFFKEQSKILGFGEAIYALYNSQKIDLIERNDFSSFHHKAQMRLCYNAQQEIFDVVYKQVMQLNEMGVKGAEKFLPPCTVRKAQGIHPICPEGDRYCGVKVWKLDIKDYHRVI